MKNKEQEIRKLIYESCIKEGNNLSDIIEVRNKKGGVSFYNKNDTNFNTCLNISSDSKYYYFKIVEQDWERIKSYKEFKEKAKNFFKKSKDYLL